MPSVELKTMVKIMEYSARLPQPEGATLYREVARRVMNDAHKIDPGTFKSFSPGVQELLYSSGLATRPRQHTPGSTL